MTPVNRPTVFTNASSKTNKGAVIWHMGDSVQWHKRVLTLKDASVQILELAALRYTFQLFSQEPLNIVTDVTMICCQCGIPFRIFLFEKC